MNEKIKPCKGCRYLRRTYLGHECSIKYKVVLGHKNELSGYFTPSTLEGFIPIVEMRSAEGDCGIERKLYDTYTRAFLRWLFN